MPKKVLGADPDRPPRGMSLGTQAGNMVFISGQVGRDAAGKVSPSFDAQARQAFKNMETVVRAAGGSMADVVKITCYVRRTEDLPAYRAVRVEVFPVDPPASSTVVVSGLGGPEYLVEIEAIAVLA